jgi:uncharacterized damage-inducible protein DinB
MNVTALVQLQLDHNVWATRQLIDASKPLAPEAFEKDFGIGPGSLRVTFGHVIESMFFFAANFAHKRYEEPTDFKAKSQAPDGLIELLERAATELNAVMLPFVERAGTGTSVPWPSAKSGALPAFAAVAQVFDHGTHHRAQCKHMLKRHGLTQLPATDPLSMDDLRRAAAR